MTKKTRTKRVIAMLIVLVMAFSIFSVQATAYTGSFSAALSGTMNALYGGTSARWAISLPTLPPNSVVMGVTISFTVSSGSDSCYIYVQCPAPLPIGTTIRFGPYRPGTYTITIPGFNGLNPQGTWYVWIQTTGIVSTVTITRIVINYYYP